MLQIGAAVFVGRRADGQKDQVAVCHALGRVGGEAQAASGLVALHDRRQAGLVDRHLAGLQRGDLGGVDVDAHHVVPHIGQHGALNQTDVAGAENGDFHMNLSVV